MVLLDLFSGIGGFPLGFMQAGVKFTTHYFSEIDPHAIANYQYNFPNAIYAGAVEKIKSKEINKPDIITFGFPCQDISAAGQHKGLTGKRSGLFYQALRLIRELEPSVFIFENVKGVLSSNQGKDFETVLKEVANLGLYDCQWQLLNTAWFLPQHRERIYFVGCIRGKSFPQIFPITERDFLSVKGLTERKTRKDKSTLAKYIQYDKNGKSNQTQSDRIYRTDKTSPTLTLNNSRRIKFYKEKKLRRLTPIECERLQGFPHDWTHFGIYKGETIEIADTNRYHLLGNAVSVPVAKAVAQRLQNQKATLHGLCTFNQ